MSVTYIASWTCDNCKLNIGINGPDASSMRPPKDWAWVIEPHSKHFCPKCAKEKGL